MSPESAGKDLQSQLKRSSALHFIGGLLLIISTTAFVVVLFKQVEQIWWVNHTYEVKAALNEYLYSLKSVESASRGYIASGAEHFLKSLPLDAQRADRAIEKVRKLSEDNARQTALIPKLKELSEQKIRFNTDLIIAPAKAGNIELARKLMGSMEGFNKMQEIENLAARMNDEEQRLLTMRQNAVTDMQNVVFAFAGVLTILGMIALLYSYRSSKNFLQVQSQQLELAIKAEENQKRISDQLERSNKDLQQFAYVASHDLQEPLRAVGGFLSLLSERYSDKLDETGQKWIAQAVEGAERMRVLINDLLTFARVETRGGKIEQVDVAAVINAAIDNLRVAINETGTTVSVQTKASLKADKTQLVQLFQNLIGNSIKYRAASSPLITISSKEDGDDFLFTVSDNGIGFDMEHAQRIFVIFQRLHTRTEYTGTGIGLALCSRIVERHGGRIWAESKPGEGARFYFTLPKQRSHEDDSGTATN